MGRDNQPLCTQLVDAGAHERATLVSRAVRLGVIGALVAGAWIASPVTGVLAANPVPPFSECPAIGADTSCGILLIIAPGGGITVLADPSQGPYDSSEDTLVGVENQSGGPVPSITLTSTSNAIFGFEQDGICTFAFTGNSYCSAADKAGTDPGDYAGPDNTFSNISANAKTGKVNFKDAGGGLPSGSHTYFSLEGTPTPASLTGLTVTTVAFNTGSATTSDFHDPATVAATLTAMGIGVPGVPVTFTIDSGAGAATCTGTTGSTGIATCSITPNEAAGSHQITASFPGNSTLGGSAASQAFTVTHEQDGLAYTGATAANNGSAVTLSGKLTTDDPAAGTALGGKTVTLTLGSGASAQSCNGTTASSGAASCSISSVKQTVGSVAVSASFAGDAFYLPATATGTVAISPSTGVAGTGLTPTPNTGAGAGQAVPGGALALTGAGLFIAGFRRRRRRPASPLG